MKIAFSSTFNGELATQIKEIQNLSIPDKIVM